MRDLSGGVMINNGHCSNCRYNPICAYEYKPCDCAQYRKFKQHPDAKDCPESTCFDGKYMEISTCFVCKGAGMIMEG